MDYSSEGVRVYGLAARDPKQRYCKAIKTRMKGLSLDFRAPTSWRTNGYLISMSASIPPRALNVARGKTQEGSRSAIYAPPVERGARFSAPNYACAADNGGGVTFCFTFYVLQGVMRTSSSGFSLHRQGA
jgi:hypothetical protein